MPRSETNCFLMTMNDNDRNTGLSVVLSMTHGLDASDASVRNEVKRCRFTSEHRICVYSINVVLSTMHGLGSVRNEENMSIDIYYLLTSEHRICVY